MHLNEMPDIALICSRKTQAIHSVVRRFCERNFSCQSNKFGDGFRLTARGRSPLHMLG